MRSLHLRSTPVLHFSSLLAPRRAPFASAASAALGVAFALAPLTAEAQSDAQTLPPLPGMGPEDVPPPPPSPPPAPPGISPIPPVASGTAAPRARSPRHAPRYSLWTGARFGVLGFGGGFYGVGVGNPPTPTTEWTTQLVNPGPTLQADIGVRLGRRFIPFVFYEHAILGVGRRFEGDTGTAAYSDLWGMGLRFSAGDVDTAAFLTEISIGERTVGVSANGQTYTISGLEYFKLGLGAEIRITSLLVLSPLASLSTGAMTNTSGAVTFSAAGSADGVKQPPYENGAPIQDQRGYVMFSLTCGAHFDLLGK
jgi:hypothetical protein